MDQDPNAATLDAIVGRIRSTDAAAEAHAQRQARLQGGADTPVAQTLRELRADAGERYAAAARAFEDAWVALMGADLCAGNANVRAVGLFERLSGTPEIPMHPVFMPTTTPPHLLNERAGQVNVELLARFG